MKGDIGMANYEKQVEQEAEYPIPISLYNCYRTVRHEKRGTLNPSSQLHCHSLEIQLCIKKHFLLLSLAKLGESGFHLIAL